MNLRAWLIFWAWMGIWGAVNAQGQPPLEGVAQCDSLVKKIRATMSQNRKSDSIISYANRLIQEGEKWGLEKYIGRGLYFRGTTESEIGNREAGLATLQQAKEKLWAAQDSNYLPRVQYSIGAVQYLQEDLEAAQQSVEEAIGQSRAMRDTTTLVTSVNIMALIQKDLGNYEAAADYLKRYMSEVTPRLKYYLMQNLGLVWKEKGDPTLAKPYFAQVEAYYRQEKKYPEWLVAVNNLASVELSLQQPDSAWKWLAMGEPFLDDYASPRLKGVFWLNMGTVFQNKGNCQQALPHFVKARNLFRELGEQKNLALVLENEGNCRFELGQAQQAYPVLKEAKAILDSLNDVDRTTALAELDGRYQRKEQQQRIIELEQEKQLAESIAEIESQKVRNQRMWVALGIILALLAGVGAVLVAVYQRSRYLHRSEQDRQMLLRQQIKPHFIFNALNSVQHFLLHDQKKEGLRYLGKLGTLLRLILNNSETDCVALEQELDLIHHYLEMEQVRTNHKFDFQIQRPEGWEWEQLQVPGMILQVLVENAIWHGAVPIEGKGEIIVAVEGNENAYSVSVRDNGPGISATKPHLDREKHQSVGLDLVRRRLSRLAGKKGLAKGTQYHLSLVEWKKETSEIGGTIATITIKSGRR